MKYKTQSANVLNDADRFEQILNVTLFNQAQDQLLWGHNPDVDWRPGDPIYEDPRWAYDYRPEHGALNWEDGDWGNHVRPMIQEYIDGNRPARMRCEPCGVSWSWNSKDDICWMCGEERPYSPGLLDFFSISPMLLHLPPGYAEWRNSVAAHVDAEVIRPPANAPRFEFNFTIQEMHIERQMLVFMTGMQTAMDRAADDIRVTSRRVHAIFSRRNGRTELSEAAATIRGFRPQFTLLDEMPPYRPVRFEIAGVELPSNWATLRSEIPMPELPEPPDYSEWQPYGRGTYPS